jgi:hypothetical protein
MGSSLLPPGSTLVEILLFSSSALCLLRVIGRGLKVSEWSRTISLTPPKATMPCSRPTSRPPPYLYRHLHLRHSHPFARRLLPIAIPLGCSLACPSGGDSVKTVSLSDAGAKRRGRVEANAQAHGIVLKQAGAKMKRAPAENSMVNKMREKATAVQTRKKAKELATELHAQKDEQSPKMKNVIAVPLRMKIITRSPLPWNVSTWLSRLTTAQNLEMSNWRERRRQWPAKKTAAELETTDKLAKEEKSGRPP